MSKFNSKLVKLDGTHVQEANGQSVDDIVEGVRRLLERDDFKEMWLFRRHPLHASGEDLNVHIKIEVAEDE